MKVTKQAGGKKVANDRDHWELGFFLEEQTNGALAGDFYSMDATSGTQVWYYHHYHHH